ncbi:MAG: carbon-nitrogen hydrolase family protein [Hyphomicrobiaceae bacterium]|nr:carbon-nitrogen hydrolase family protein [Hyphomicrobiaceae bacterium]
MQNGVVRIAAAQYPPDRLADLAQYRAKIARWVGEAAAGGAELLVFPEYGAMEWAGVLGPHTLAQSLAFVSEAMPEMDAAHRTLAQQHGVYILAGSGPWRREGGRFVNAARLFAPSGAVGVQEKLIMTPFERDWGISGGGSARVFETKLGRIGVAICYDSEFPLIVRAQVEAGARLILVPSCTEFRTGHNRIRAAAMARALEGTCASVVAPIVGLAPWSPSIDVNVGAAGIFVPAERGSSETGVIAEGVPDQPGWITGEVDLAALEGLATSGEMRNRGDWDAQPGATALGGHVEVVRLD